jgi:hypothetical protein
MDYEIVGTIAEPHPFLLPLFTDVPIRGILRSSSNLYLTEVPGRGCLWLAAAARESTGRYEKVRVREDHRVWELGGAVGKVVGSYGGEELMVLGVHFPDGGYQLLWPGDVDDVGSSEPWWRCLLGNRK